MLDLDVVRREGGQEYPPPKALGTSQAQRNSTRGDEVIPDDRDSGNSIEERGRSLAGTFPTGLERGGGRSDGLGQGTPSYTQKLCFEDLPTRSASPRDP